MRTTFLSAATVAFLLSSAACAGEQPPAAKPTEEPARERGEESAPKSAQESAKSSAGAQSPEPQQGISPRGRQAQRAPRGTQPIVDRPATLIDLPPQLRAQVIAAAAARAGVAEAQVVVRGAEAIQFPDGSLGCPQPGMMYTQMVVPGYRVVVEAGGRTFDYRSARGGEPSICEPRVGELVPRPGPRDSNR